MAEGFEGLLEAVTADLRDRAGSVPGALVETKASSVAVHYRLVDEADRPRIKAIVDELLTRHAGDLKVTAGKMVYELQPNLDWDKGKAVMHLLEALGLDGDDVVPLYVGDDITDEDAFATLAGRGIGIVVADPDDPEVDGRSTRAEFVVRDPRRGPRPARRAGCDGAREGARARLRRLRPRRRGPARSADVDRQRLSVHARHGRMGGRGRHALPGDVRPRRLQPRDDDHGRPAGTQRGPRQPPEPARAQAAGRGRGAVLARERRAARLPPRVRHPQRGRPAPAALPRPRGPRDVADQPPVREHEPHAPGGRGLGPRARELVGAARDRVGGRRARHQPGRRALPAARGSSSRSTGAAHLRRRHHRPEGAHAPVADRDRRRRTDPVLPHRSGDPGHASDLPDRGLHPAGARLRRPAGRAGAGREDGRDLHVARPGDHGAAAQRGAQRRSLPGLRRGAARPRARLGGAVGRLRRPRSAASRARSSCCGCTSHTFSRPARA